MARDASPAPAVSSPVRPGSGLSPADKANLDNANMLTQNRVSQANPFLPPEVKELGVTTKKSLTFPLMLVSLCILDPVRAESEFMLPAMPVSVRALMPAVSIAAPGAPPCIVLESLTAPEVVPAQAPCLHSCP